MHLSDFTVSSSLAADHEFLVLPVLSLLSALVLLLLAVLNGCVDIS
jgi:hypothetical protein